MTNEILQKYEKRKNQFSVQLAGVEKKISLISNIRLAMVVSTLVSVIILYKLNHQTFSGIVFMAGLTGFIIIIRFHDRLFTTKDRLNILIKINTNGIKRVTDEWHIFNNNGKEFINDDHPYTTDINVFGNSSIFQWINATHTYFGKKFLSSTLADFQNENLTSSPADFQNENLPDINESVNPERIKENQEAVKELAPLLDFRQNIEEACFDHHCSENPQSIIDWSESKNNNCVNKKLAYILTTLPYLSLGILIADLLHFKTILNPSLLYIIQIIIFGLYYKKTQKILNTFENKSKLLNHFSKIIKHIEDQKFSSHLLKDLQKKLANNNGILTFQSIKEIANIIAKTEVRYGGMSHFLINSFWLWDIKYAIKAEKWKVRNGIHIRNWFTTVGYFEKLSSLAIIHFEHPEWAFPIVNTSGPMFNAKNIKHPLIPQKVNIGNDFLLSKEKNIAIITGSNMSGKSTFLRTIAGNLILAYAGAPVCADEMTCGIVNIYTSMIKTDNLKGNVSTFYSELLRIKNIVDLANKGKNLLFLIDEIFNGTNSQDRTTGATAVLDTLQLNNTMGVISTHDLKLCDLSDNPGSKFINYHFREYYKNNSINFDYKIYPGPSKTRNAIFLIKMAGIPIRKL